MTHTMHHRGPDGAGFYSEGPIALGHARLSIIDLEGGAQPQFNEDGTIAVVFNGEIYNYPELFAELRGRHVFRTQSDTEVLVHLYEELGRGMLGKLRGMYAFALWDTRTQTLLLARDRVGEKPLYYVHSHGRLAFASEFAALEQSAEQLGAIDRTSLASYLELLYVPAPRTIRVGVKKLPAGHLLIADASGVKVEQYWSAPVSGLNPHPLLNAVTLRRALEQSIELTIRSDVPIGALLSGGVDSSAVVGLLAHAVGPCVKTFSVGFGDRSDELPFARMVAKKHRTDHHEIVLHDSVEQNTTDAFNAFGEPFGDSSAVPTLAVFREVSKSVKVVLTGDGGDELFAGYDRYRVAQAWPFCASLRSLASALERTSSLGRIGSLERAARILGTRGGARHRASIEVFPQALRHELMRSIHPASVAYPNLAENGDCAIAFDLAVYLPDDLLMKTDIASMRSGVEARCPLLDYTLAELVVPEPLGAKVGAAGSKLLFKEAIADLVPPVVLTRPKRGFGSPVKNWLRGPLKHMFMDLLTSPNAHTRSWFEARTIDRILSSATTRSGNAHQGWALLALEAWARRHA